MNNSQLENVIEVAKLYYQQDYNQHEIANMLGVSRPTVSRLLKTAKDKGIVQITIIDDKENHSNEKLAQELKQKFNLKYASVVSVSDHEKQHTHALKKMLGKTAAAYLNEITRDGDSIGVTWGTTLYHVATELKPSFAKNLQVVQLKGGVSHSETSTYSSEILQMFGEAFHSAPLNLPLPAIVEHVAVKEAMETDKHIRHVLEAGKQTNIAMFTCGTIQSDSLLFQLGYFSEEDLQNILTNAVGDISSRFYNKRGEICNQRLNERTLGIGLDDLKEKEYSILIAGENKKADAIYGALKGGYANVLFTDQSVARFLLEQSP